MKFDIHKKEREEYLYENSTGKKIPVGHSNYKSYEHFSEDEVNVVGLPYTLCMLILKLTSATCNNSFLWKTKQY